MLTPERRPLTVVGLASLRNRLFLVWVVCALAGTEQTVEAVDKNNDIDSGRSRFDARRNDGMIEERRKLGEESSPSAPELGPTLLEFFC